VINICKHCTLALCQRQGVLLDKVRGRRSPHICTAIHRPPAPLRCFKAIRSTRYSVSNRKNCASYSENFRGDSQSETRLGWARFTHTTVTASARGGLSRDHAEIVSTTLVDRLFTHSLVMSTSALGYGHSLSVIVMMSGSGRV
jgi:hypothetical protein